MNKIVFSIGDWSLDGHTCVSNFVVESKQNVEDVREAHFTHNEFIGDLCGEYHKSSIDLEEIVDFCVIQKVNPLDFLAKINGLILQTCKNNKKIDIALNNPKLAKFMRDSANGVEVEQSIEIVCDEDNGTTMVQIWIEMLNILNPAFELKLVSEAHSNKIIQINKGFYVNDDLVNKNIKTLHFYGIDKEGRHLNVPGYGCWRDYSGEFQNSED